MLVVVVVAVVFGLAWPVLVGPFVDLVVVVVCPCCTRCRLAEEQIGLVVVDQSSRAEQHRRALDFVSLEMVRFDSEPIVEEVPHSSIECTDMDIELDTDWTRQYIELEGFGWAQIFAHLDTFETVVLEFAHVEDGTFVCVCVART